MEQDKEHKKMEKLPAELNQNTIIEATCSNSQAQSQDQDGTDENSIPDFPAGKKPVLKNGRVK